MSGKSEEEILATRQKEINEIYQFANKDNVQVNIIDSYIDDETRNGFQGYMTNVINWDVYWISHALQKLSMANILWLGKGWEKSKGCQIEKQCAQAYGIPIIKSPRNREE